MRLLTAFLVVLIAPFAAPTQTLPVHVLHNFIGQAWTMAPLVEGPDGDLYGVTQAGPGTSWRGQVFKVTPSGVFTTLVAFTGYNGQAPMGLVVGSDGNFYGTTSHGGNSHLGTVFRMTPNGTLTTLVHFNNANGRQPLGLLVEYPDGDFYGIAVTDTNVLTHEGTHGIVFKVTTNGLLNTLVTFPYGSGPTYLTLGSDGSLYGTTCNGVFRLTTNGTVTTRAIVPPGCPTSLTLGNDGHFYGTTFWGGNSGVGAAFRVTTKGALTTLVNFNRTNGALPAGGLTQGKDGNFYGTTVYGGAFEGTVFRMMPDGTLTTLAHFTSRSTGVRPYGGVTFGRDGSLYGTTITGGTGDSGIIFRVDLPPTIISQPVSRTNLMGTTTTFSVTAMGTEPLSYQWLKDGTILLDGGNVSGARAATLTLVNVQPEDAGNFAVVVSNDLGTVISSMAVLVIFSDADGDGVLDGQDLCPGTPPGAVADDLGCSIAQYVPCAGPATGGTWKNHGQYLVTLTAVADAFLEAGLITLDERNAVVRAATRSDCGK